MNLGRTVVVAIALVIGAVVSFGAQVSPVETGCDVTGPDIKSLKQTDAAACQVACENLQACRGWSFISGWNRCFLKSKINSKTNVRMYAGRINRQGKSPFIAQEGWDKDDSGRDYRKVAPLMRVEDCSAECTKDERCMAFVFINGYKTCWLKESTGRWSNKVFSCGIKP